MAIARRFGAKVTAVDISPIMLARARSNVQRTGLPGHVTVTYGDILALDFPDNRYDRVIAEAVTMFVDRPRAVRELIRVCKPGGRVLATEFFWREPPPSEAREIFLGQVCPGMQVDTLEEWVRLYEEAGLGNTQVVSGPFEMMTPAGFLSEHAGLCPRPRREVENGRMGGSTCPGDQKGSRCDADHEYDWSFHALGTPVVARVGSRASRRVRACFGRPARLGGLARLRGFGRLRPLARLWRLGVLGRLRGSRRGVLVVNCRRDLCRGRRSLGRRHDRHDPLAPDHRVGASGLGVGA